jgi:hypothetical protein
MRLKNVRWFAALGALVLLVPGFAFGEGDETRPPDNSPQWQSEDPIDAGMGSLGKSPQVDVTLCTDTFEDGFPGNAGCGWTLRWCGAAYTWNDTNCRAASGSKSVWCAGGLGADGTGLDACSSYYDNQMCAKMVAGPFDLRDATSAAVNFDFWLRCGGEYTDYLWVGYSTNGINFTSGEKFTGDWGDTWNRSRNYALPGSIVGNANVPQVWVAFGFTTDTAYRFPSIPDGAFVDNVRIVKGVGSAPDLVVTGLGFDSATCPTQVRAKIRNQGSAAAGGNTCRLWRGSTQLPDVGVRALAAGEEDWSGWSSLGSYAPGDYAARACADIGGVIQELDEANNCSTYNYTGWCMSADLTVTALGFDNANCPTQVRAKVKNVGGATAATSTCRFWLDSVLQGNASIRSLAAGEEDWSSWYALGSHSGDHAVQSCVDPDNSIPEANENNNCLTGNYTNWCLSADLAVAAMEFDPPNCATRMRAQISNVGTAAAASSVCRFKVDGVQKCDITVGTIAAGASVWTDWCSIGASGPGSWEGNACADATGLISESNENNNCLTQDFGCSTDRFYIPAGVSVSAGEGSVQIPIRATNSLAITAFSVSLCFDPDVFTFKSANVAGTRAAGAQNVIYSTPQDGCVSVAVVKNYACASAVPAGDGLVLNVVMDVAAGAPNGTATFTFTDRSPSLNRMTLCDFSTLVPGFGTGTVEVQSNGFVRGDYDADGTLELADALAGLYYAIGESDPPTCEDAADLNDDGVVDVSDGVYSLGFQFGGGDDPALPYPGCGEDPTSDVLGCTSFAGCGPPALKAQASSTPAATISLTPRYSAKGDSLTLPMLLDLPEAAVGFDLTLEFDPAVLGYAGISRTGAAADLDFFSARLLADGNRVRLGAVRDLGLRSVLPNGRHEVGSLVFVVRDVAALEGSRIAIENGEVVLGPGAAVDLTGAVLVLPGIGSGSGNSILLLTNPYRPDSPISVDLDALADVQLHVYSVQGRRVRDIIHHSLGVGRHELRWDGKDNAGVSVGGGVYYLSVDIGDRVLTRKVILLR